MTGFRVSVHPRTATGGLRQTDALLGGLGKTDEPAQGIVDVFVLEASGYQTFRQYIRRGASLRVVVVFKQVYQDIKHMQKPDACCRPDTGFQCP